MFETPETPVGPETRPSRHPRYRTRESRRRTPATSKGRAVNANDLGRAGLAGWRETVADKTAPPVAARTPVDEDAIRAAIGALFFVLSLIYVVGTIKRALGTLKS